MEFGEKITRIGQFVQELGLKIVSLKEVSNLLNQLTDFDDFFTKLHVLKGAESNSR